MANELFSQRDTKYGILFGNAASGDPTFTATTGVLSLAYAGLPIQSSVVFNKNVNVRTPDRMNGQRTYTLEDADVDRKASIPMATMKLPWTSAIGDLVCACIFQGVSEGASTPYPKTFDVPTTYPDFSGTAGGYVSLLKSYPATISAATYDEYMNSCVARKVTFSCYPEQDEGRLMMDIEWIGRYYAVGDYSGTLTYPTSFTYKHFADLAGATIAGTNFLCSGFTITFECQIVPKPVGGAGTLGTVTYTPEFWKVSGSIDAELDTNTVVYLNSATAGEGGSSGTAYLLELWWGSKTGASSGDLYFKLPNVKFISHAYKGSENDIRTMNFTGFQKISSTAAKLFTVIMANAVDRGAANTNSIWG